MVTTRSAEKRAANEEHLVLRSKVGHHSVSTASTPTQGRKRVPVDESETASQRAKRARSEHDDNGDLESAITPTRTNAGQTSSDSTVSHFTTPATSLEVRNDAGSDAVKFSVAGTPQSQEPNQEVFRTPATSLHKRFDSDVSDEGLVLHATGTDSSTHNDYHTAEEGDNSDEEPEVLTSKTSSWTTRRRGRPKPGDEHPLNNSERPANATPLSSVKSEVVFPSEHVADGAQPTPSTNAKASNASLTSATSLTDVAKQASELHTSRLSDQSILTEPKSLLTYAGNTLTESKSSVDEKAKSAISLEPADAPEQNKQHLRIRETDTSFLASPWSTSTTPLQPSDFAIIRPKQRRSSIDVSAGDGRRRMPSKQRNSFENFRRNQIKRHVSLQSSWSKKRSAFATS